jgi:hypothetical protein
MVRVAGKESVDILKPCGPDGSRLMGRVIVDKANFADHDAAQKTKQHRAPNMKAILSTILLLLLGVWHAAAADLSKFTGAWQVDLERTWAEGKKSTKYNPKEEAEMPAAFKSMISGFKLKITAKELIYSMAGKNFTIPFTVENVTDKSAVIVVKANDRTEKFTLTLIDDKFLNLRTAAGTGDQDFYIWKHAP